MEIWYTLFEKLTCRSFYDIVRMKPPIHTVWKIDIMSNGPLVKTKRPPKEQRIDTIAESARKVFCQRGYKKASIAEIAGNAGIAEGTIYRYFDGKRSLLYEVLRRHYSAVFEEIDRTLPGIQGQGNRLRYLFTRFLLAIEGSCRACASPISTWRSNKA